METTEKKPQDLTILKPREIKEKGFNTIASLAEELV